MKPIWTRLFLSGVACVLSGLGSFAEAQESPAAPSTAERVLDELTDQAPAERIAASPAETIKALTAVAERLSGSLPTDEKLAPTTTDLQDEAIGQLEALIEAAQRSRQGSPADQTQDRTTEATPSTNTPETTTSTPSPEGTDDTGSDNGSGPASTTTGDGRSPEESERSDTADGSEERNDTGTVLPDEMLRRRERLIRVWGHLPPGLRVKMLNISREQYLPAYKDRIRRYYDALDRVD